MQYINEQYFDKTKTEKKTIEASGCVEFNIRFVCQKIRSDVGALTNTSPAKFMALWKKVEHSLKDMKMCEYKNAKFVFAKDYSYTDGRIWYPDFTEYESLDEAVLGVSTLGLFGFCILIKVSMPDDHSMEMRKRFYDDMQSVYHMYAQSLHIFTRLDYIDSPTMYIGDTILSEGGTYSSYMWCLENILGVEHESSDLIKKAEINVGMEYDGTAMISRKSRKKLNQFKLGDVLYSTLDGHLVGESRTNSEDNIPIAICASNSENDNFVDFMALNCLSTISPNHGSKNLVGIVYGGSVKDALYPFNGFNKYTSGLDVTKTAWKTFELCRGQDYLHDRIISNSSGVLDDQYPVFGCAYRFHTLGTKMGQWFVPGLVEMIRALSKFYTENALDKTRRKLGYPQLSYEKILTATEVNEEEFVLYHGSSSTQNESCPKTLCAGCCLPFLRIKKSVNNG